MKADSTASSSTSVIYSTTSSLSSASSKSLTSSQYTLDNMHNIDKTTIFKSTNNSKKFNKDKNSDRIFNSYALDEKPTKFDVKTHDKNGNLKNKDKASGMNPLLDLIISTHFPTSIVHEESMENLKRLLNTSIKLKLRIRL